MFDDLNDDNFLIFAMKCYDTPRAILSEFQEDIKRIKWLKRQIRKYRLANELNERLILNHIIVLGNVFGVPNAVRMMFFKLSPEDYPTLKTHLIFLDQMPDIVRGIGGRNIRSTDIPVDLFVADRLRTTTRGAV